MFNRFIDFRPSDDRNFLLQSHRHRYLTMFICGMTMNLLMVIAGSWLEIGQTISFFCISSLLLVWSAGICALGERLLAGTKVDSPHKKAE